MTSLTSIVLTISFIIVSLTGLTMDLRPRSGPPPSGAVRDGATGDAKSEAGVRQKPPARPRSIFPRQLHIWSGYLFMIAAVVHIALNWHPLLRAFGLRRKRGGAGSTP